MATINLGRIKPVFRGAYAGGTAYVVDDIVTHGNESFICIQAGTGNATSNASYWTKLAAKGSDGTDVGTTLTTQGDILYRDGSGLQRLGYGTAGQVLQTGGSGANPSWGTVSSDYVKIGTYTANNVSSLVIDNIFSTTYSTYQIISDRVYGGNGDWLSMRYVNSGTTDSANKYNTILGYAYVQSGTQGYSSGNSGWHTSSNQGYIHVTSSDASYRSSMEMTIFNPANSDSDADRLRCVFQAGNWNGTSRYDSRQGSIWYNNVTAPTGIEFRNSGTNFYGKFRVYGIK